MVRQEYGKLRINTQDEHCRELSVSGHIAETMYCDSANKFWTLNSKIFQLQFRKQFS